MSERAKRYIGQVMFPIQPDVPPSGLDNRQIAEWLYAHGIRPRWRYRRELWHNRDGSCRACCELLVHSPVAESQGR